MIFYLEAPAAVATRHDFFVNPQRRCKAIPSGPASQACLGLDQETRHDSFCGDRPG